LRGKEKLEQAEIEKKEGKRGSAEMKKGKSGRKKMYT
jgi:hypothetical protein